MKHMDIDCYERGCACVSSSRVAGENVEVVEVVSLRELTDEEILGAVARGWCSEKNSSKTMDSDLAVAIADEIKALIKKASEE